MKNVLIVLTCIVAVAVATPVCAEEQDNPLPVQSGLTYIRYRLNHGALPAFDPDHLEQFMKVGSDTTTLTFKDGVLNNIDAYFELTDPEFVPGSSRYEAFEATLQWVPESPLNGTLCKEGHNDRAACDDVAVSWNIGDLALALDYDRRDGGNLNDTLFLNSEHRLRGSLNMPLGESGFSLGAYLAMYEAKDKPIQNIFTEGSGSQGVVQTPFVETPDIPSIAQTAFAREPQDEMAPAQISVSKGSSNRSAVLGAINLSGAVKGVDVFTEVGFASDTGDYAVVDDVETAGFYALGGAKYTIGQVTVGVEAGFENSGDPEFANALLGFEDNFWSDSVIEAGMPVDESTNNLYAKVSAGMNPTEKIRVEGAFSCVTPVEEIGAFGTYDLEVNGTFHYSLTNYVKYLIKAGIDSLEEYSLEDNYRLMNRLEFNF